MTPEIPAGHVNAEVRHEKRQTEIDMFCGTVMRLAGKQGIAVPYNTFAYHIVKGLEEKNAGAFEY